MVAADMQWPDLMCRELLTSLLRDDPWHYRVLTTVRELALPDWAIGAGFVRNRVWDHLQGHARASDLADIDVLYFDPADGTGASESAWETALGRLAPGLPWSVKNQARMHLRNTDPPYRDTADALAHWLETPTSVAVRLEPDDKLTVMAPHGLRDLWELRVRPTPSGLRRLDEYRTRMKIKNWPATWPKVRVEGLR